MNFRSGFTQNEGSITRKITERAINHAEESRNRPRRSRVPSKEIESKDNKAKVIRRECNIFFQDNTLILRAEDNAPTISMDGDFRAYLAINAKMIRKFLLGMEK